MNQSLSLKEYLNDMREKRDQGELFTHSEQGARILARLELIERLFPDWLEYSSLGTPLSRAVFDWHYDRFALLIGRGITYPVEPLFMRSQVPLLEIVLKGMEPDVGRKRLTEEEQEMIFNLWVLADIPQKLLSDMYSVSTSTVERIIRKYKKSRKIYDV